ncbi:unnamed protein product [Leptosia nina]|uniref:Uncharacterized protein n=1 Tax=Leptosia nina TaxID=320188 RepID=A0AAV1K724_9NEOP
MGCTSSAPDIADTSINATEKTQKQIVATVDERNSKANNKNEESVDYNREVLPISNNFVENIQLPSYNSLFSNTEKELSIKGTKETEKICEISFKSDNNEIIKSEEKLSTFIEVADKVLINKIIEDVKFEESAEEAANVDKEIEKDVTNNLVEEDVYEPEEVIVEDLDDKDDIRDNLEHESPTQSESRSTRWEALADIAAELPPTLAMDPVTGHIYSLTK